MRLDSKSMTRAKWLKEQTNDCSLNNHWAKAAAIGALSVESASYLSFRSKIRASWRENGNRFYFTSVYDEVQSEAGRESMWRSSGS